MIIVIRNHNRDTVLDTTANYDLSMTVDQHNFWMRVTDILDPLLTNNTRIEIIDTDSLTVTDINIHTSAKTPDMWLAYSIRSGIVINQIATMNKNTVIWSILYDTYMAA